MAQPMPLDGIQAPASSVGPKFLMLFSLPFCGVGLWMAFAALTAMGQGEELREVSLRGVFAVVFGGVGFGLLFFSRHLARRAEQERTLRARHPDEPWRWRVEWATGRVPAKDGAETLVICVFAGLWNAMMVPLLMDFGSLPPIVAIFPLFGLGLLVWAVRAFWRQRRFGRCVFEMATLPGVLGGPLQGAVQLPVSLNPAHGFLLELACVHRVTTGSGKTRSVQESERWSEERTLPSARGLATPQGTSLPVSFEIPHDLPPSTVESSDDEVVWRLSARADVPGVDFAATFEIPVIHTEASRRRADDVRMAEPAISIGPSPTPVTPGARITASRLPDDGVEIHFPAARSPSGAAALTLFALVWNASLLVMGMHVPTPVLFFLAIFALVGVFLVLGALDAWFGSIRIEIRPGRLGVTRSFLGIGKTKIYGPGEIGDFRVRPNGHLGSKTFYALKGRRAGRTRRSVLADGLTDRLQAERVLQLVERGFGGSAA